MSRYSPTHIVFSIRFTHNDFAFQGNYGRLLWELQAFRLNAGGNIDDEL